MKAILLPILLFVSMVCFAAPSGKVLKAFQATFPNAKNVKWYENTVSSEMSYAAEVRFQMDSITYTVYYDSEATIFRMIRYYRALQLPATIRAKLQNRFKEASIYGVTELTEDGIVTYSITLQTVKNWLDVRSDGEGNLMLQHKYNKKE